MSAVLSTQMHLSSRSVAKSEHSGRQRVDPGSGGGTTTAAGCSGADAVFYTEPGTSVTRMRKVV